MDAKNLKEVIVAGCVGFQAYEDAKKDGKIDGADILYLIPFAQAVGPAIQDINLVPAEALDLDREEMADLIAAVKEKVPALKDAAAVLQRIQAVANLLLAAKECFVVFSGKAPVMNLGALDMGKGLHVAKLAEIEQGRAAPAAAAAPAAVAAAPVNDPAAPVEA